MGAIGALISAGAAENRAARRRRAGVMEDDIAIALHGVFHDGHPIRANTQTADAHRRRATAEPIDSGRSHPMTNAGICGMVVPLTVRRQVAPSPEKKECKWRASRRMRRDSVLGDEDWLRTDTLS